VKPGTQPGPGEPSPTAPLATTMTTPTVTIGGKTAQVPFSGLAPTIVGLYQVNAIIPDSIGTGLQQVSLSIGGVASPTTMIWVQ
jgi:uncharacterized protein (TIGR03437 family)